MGEFVEGLPTAMGRRSLVVGMAAEEQGCGGVLGQWRQVGMGGEMVGEKHLSEEKLEVEEKQLGDGWR